MRVFSAILLVLAAFLFSLSSFAQHTLEPRSYDFGNRWSHYINSIDTIYHQGFSPQVISRKTWKSFRSIDREQSNRTIKNKWWYRKLRDESVVEVEGSDFFIAGDVLFNLQLGRDLSIDSIRNLSTNTRGARIYGNIGNKVYFESTLHENQSFYPKYLSDSIRAYRVIPGQGVPKGFRETGFDYAFVTGLVNFNLNQHFNFQFGHDKLFIGHGYRSVLMSDNAFNYPFLKMAVTFLENKVQYQNTWAQLQTLDRIPNSGQNEPFYIRRGGSFHYLSISPNSKIEVGLFEGITWQRWNRSEGTMDFDYNFINPMIFANTIIQRNNDKYDTLTVSSIGINARVNPIDKVTVYGQLAQQNNEDINWQLGLFANHLGVRDLSFRAEYNYALANVVISHYSQSLGHISRGNFNEWIIQADYRWYDAFIKTRFIQAFNESDVQHEIVDLRLGYLMNPVSNLNFYLGYMNRNATNSLTQWVYLGMQTNINNRYYDF